MVSIECCNGACLCVKEINGHYHFWKHIWRRDLNGWAEPFQIFNKKYCNDPSMCWCVTRLSFSNASKDPSCTKAQLPLCCCFYLTGQGCVGGWWCTLWHICGACCSPRFPHRPPCTCSSCSKTSLAGSSRQRSNEATIWGESCNSWGMHAPLWLHMMERLF